MDYGLLTQQLLSLAQEDGHFVPLLANASALLMEALPDINWAGFYLARGERLVLGPFQGKPACIHIPWGKGVCGAAWAQDRALRVDDVHQFPGHIACDGASNAEIVVPLHQQGRVIGVMDIDSPVFGRFSPADEEGLVRFARALEQSIVMEDQP